MSTTDSQPIATSASSITEWLIGRITFYDQVDAASVTPDARLDELGLDSIYALTLCGDVEDAYGVPLDPTVFAEYATLAELADGLATRAGTS